MDMMAAMFLTLPIILPAVVALGYDPIWFGIVMVVLCEMSLVTPPFGLGLFVVKGVFPDADFSEILKGSLPFVIADVALLILMLAFPDIALFLPNRM